MSIEGHQGHSQSLDVEMQGSSCYRHCLHVDLLVSVVVKGEERAVAAGKGRGSNRDG